MLKKTISLHLAGPTSLEEALKAIKSACAGPNDSGLPIYLSDEGLQAAGATRQSKVALDVEGVPVKQALQLVLDQVGLAYHVDRIVIIDAARPPSAPKP